MIKHWEQDYGLEIWWCGATDWFCALVAALSPLTVLHVARAELQWSVDLLIMDFCGLVWVGCLCFEGFFLFGLFSFLALGQKSWQHFESSDLSFLSSGRSWKAEVLGIWKIFNCILSNFVFFLKEGFHYCIHTYLLLVLKCKLFTDRLWASGRRGRRLTELELNKLVCCSWRWIRFPCRPPSQIKVTSILE